MSCHYHTTISNYSTDNYINCKVNPITQKKPVGSNFEIEFLFKKDLLNFYVITDLLLLWNIKNSMGKEVPISPLNTLISGVISGVIGIFSWIIQFKSNQVSTPN